MNKYGTYLKGQTLYSPWVIAIVTIWSIWTHILATAPDIHGNIYLRIFISAISILPGIGILFIYRSYTKNKLRSLGGVLIAIMLSGASRGLFLAILFQIFGVTNQLNLGFRIPNGMILISFAFIVSTILVAGFQEQRNVMQNLRKEKNNLLEAANVLKGRYLNKNKMFAEQITAIFFKEIEKIDISTAESAVKSLRMLVDDFVKPLSHDLMEKIPKWNSENFESITDRVTFRDVISSINPENSINIKILTTLMALQILPFISIYGAPKSFEIIGVICVIFSATLKLAKIILLKLTKEISVAARLVLIVIVLGISTLPTCSVVFLIIRQSKDPYYFFKAGPSFTILAAGLLVLVNSIQFASEKVRSELNEINDRLRWIIARINLVNWDVQGNFSRVIHGKVQSILHIAIYNLNKSIEDEVSHNLILQNAKAEIQDTLLNTMANIRNSTSIESTLIQFQENWDGIIDVVFEADSKVLATINLDHAAKNALLSVVQESINNAIQHANSTSIVFRINLLESQIVLEIENDGKAFKEFNFGNGMTELALISINYQINHYENKTLIKTNLPFVSQ